MFVNEGEKRCLSMCPPCTCFIWSSTSFVPKDMFVLWSAALHRLAHPLTGQCGSGVRRPGESFWLGTQIDGDGDATVDGSTRSGSEDGWGHVREDNSKSVGDGRRSIGGVWGQYWTEAGQRAEHPAVHSSTGRHQQEDGDEGCHEETWVSYWCSTSIVHILYHFNVFFSNIFFVSDHHIIYYVRGRYFTVESFSLRAPTAGWHMCCLWRCIYTWH